MLFLVILPAISEAGWNATNWPAWATQDRGRQRAKEVWTGRVERCYAASVSLPAEPWWDTQRTRLKTFKATDLVLLPLFVDLSKTNAAGNFNTWYTNGAPQVPPMLSVTRVAELVRIPTNYFTYTPWAGLNGYGQNTNDIAAVGHPHGETNEITAAGGTNFPAGRSVWYTTDYGWAPQKDILNLMIATKQDGSTAAMEIYTNDFDSVDADWSVVRQAFIDELDAATWSTNASDIGGRPGIVEIDNVSVTTNGANYEVHASLDSSLTAITRGRASFSGISTQASHTAQVYIPFVDLTGNPMGYPPYYTWWWIDARWATFGTIDTYYLQLTESFTAATTNARVGATYTLNPAEQLPADPNDVQFTATADGHTIGSIRVGDNATIILFWAFDKSGP